MRGLLIALGLMLAVTWLGGGYALYAVIRDDDAQAKRSTVVSAQLAEASRRYTQLQDENAKANADLKAAQTELQHPTLGIWNVHETISGPDAYLTGGIPDTFTYHLKFTSDAPVTVTYMTNRDFVNGILCVQSGRGTSHTCMSKFGQGWYDVTNLNQDIHIGEGCADYLAVFTAARAATIQPDVSVTYNPAPAPTGACA